MTALRPLLIGIGAVVRRDASIYFSYRMRVISQVTLSLFTVTLFYYVSRLVNVTRFPTADDYFAYVVVGLVILHFLTATLALAPANLRTEMVAGTFERFVFSPLGAAAGLVGITIFPTLAAFATGAVTLLFAVVFYGFPIAGPEALLAVPVAVLAAASFLPFALLVAALVLISKQAGNVGNLVVIGLSLAGGVYYPPELMPSWTRWLTEVQPYTPALELLRHLLIDAPAQGNPALDAMRLFLFAVIMLPVSIWILQGAVRLCRRRGTLTEY